MYAGHQRDTHLTAPREWKHQLTPEPSSRRRSLSQPGASQRSTQAGRAADLAVCCVWAHRLLSSAWNGQHVVQRYQRGVAERLKPNRMPVRPGRAQRHQRELRLRTAAYSLRAAVGPLARPDLCCGHLQLGRGETFCAKGAAEIFKAYTHEYTAQALAFCDVPERLPRNSPGRLLPVCLTIRLCDRWVGLHKSFPCRQASK